MSVAVETPVLSIAEGLELPLEIVTRRVGILGTSGTGKTSTAVMIAEQLRKLGIQVVVIDPTGAWWGIAHSIDGAGPGVEMVVLGGEHGVAPLSREAGKACARLVASEGLSCVLDVDRPYFTSWAARTHFVADFLSDLYELCRSRIVVIVDEAHRFAPQNVREEGGDSARALGAMSDVVALGRRRGLDVILITQRAAKLNKDVLELCQVLIAHQLRGNNDRAQLKGWLDNAGGEMKTILAAVGKLARGQAWVSAPQYDIDGAYAILPKSTYDSSADAAESLDVESSASSVDIAAIERLLADTIEQTKAEDPRELRKRIAELERQLADGHSDGREPALADRAEELEAEVAELSVRADALRGFENRARRLLRDAAPRLARLSEEFTDLCSLDLRELVSEAAEPARSASRPAPAALDYRRDRSAPPLRDERAPSKPAAQNTGPMRQRVLNGLAWWEAGGVSPVTRVQLAMVVGCHPRTGSFAQALADLVDTAIEYPAAGQVALLEAGRQDAVPPDVKPTGEALREMIYRQVGERRAEILREVVAEHPDAISRGMLADRLGYHPRTGAFAQAIADLKALGLVAYPRAGSLAATSVPFLKGR